MIGIKSKIPCDFVFLGPVQPILYIPWMVVTELDYIKDSSSSNEKLNKDVMNSIKFINTALKNKNERIVGKNLIINEKESNYLFHLLILFFIFSSNCV